MLDLSVFLPEAKMAIDNNIREKLSDIELNLFEDWLKKDKKFKEEYIHRLSTYLTDKQKDLLEWRKQLSPSWQNWLDEVFVEAIDRKLEEIKKDQTRMMWKRRPIDKLPSDYLTVDDINIARTVPITALYDREYRRQGNRCYGKCPWHDDSTPSFVIYEDSNSFNCFACNIGGDAIEYVMKDQQLEFIPAIKLLLAQR